MPTNERIAHLIKQLDYPSGLALLRERSADAFLLKMLHQGETPSNRLLMLNALRELPTDATDEEEKHESPKVSQGEDGLRFAPSAIQEVKVRRNEAIRKMGRLHELLIHEEDVEKSREYAIAILELEDIHILCWEQIDEYKSSGKLPEIETEKQKVEINIEEPALLQKRLATVRVRISQLKKKGESKADDLKRFESEKEELTDKLKTLGY